MFYRVPRLFFCLCVVVLLSVAGLAQNDIQSISSVPSDPEMTYPSVAPQSIQAQPDFLNSDSPNGIGASIHSNAGGLANVISVPNFSSSFTSQGQTWPFTMMGNDPTLGKKTTIPAKIVAVSLQLQNADLTSTTIVPVAAFEQPTLNSPNFGFSSYSSGNHIQFADAVQRAEFYNMMKQNWHTSLDASIVDEITILVPRFVTVTLNGTPTQVRTYYRGTAADGSMFVLMLNRFFNQQIFNIVNNEINSGKYTTDAVNMTLFPNTYLFSLSKTGGIGGCCTLGYHTYFTDGGQPKESRWIFGYASWISAGLFGGFEDVTALSHEISESFNDPFVNNLTPQWIFPGEPGQCQGNLETGDPVEVLSSGATVATPIKTEGQVFTYHPQTEALLQWFEQGNPSNALGGAYSYPDTTALKTSATACK